MLPLINLITAIPAVMMTNTMAKPTDNADVYLSESNITKTIKYNNQSTIQPHYALIINCALTSTFNKQPETQ